MSPHALAVVAAVALAAPPGAPPPKKSLASVFEITGKVFANSAESQAVKVSGGFQVTEGVTIDASLGFVSLTGSGEQSVKLEQARAQFRAAGDRLLVVVGDARVKIPRGQGLSVRAFSESRGRGKVFLTAQGPADSSLTLSIDQTLVRLPNASRVSLTYDRDMGRLSIQAELGLVEVFLSNGESRLLSSGQSLEDRLYLTPGEVVSDADERAPLCRTAL